MSSSWLEQNGDDYDVSGEFYEPEIAPVPSKKNNGKQEPSGFATLADMKFQKSNSQLKWMDMLKPNPNTSHVEDHLDAHLQEEEYLVNARRKQVNNTMNIVKEEMDLLVEAGTNQETNRRLHRYTECHPGSESCRDPSTADCLTNFQKRLKEHSVLVSSSAY